MRRRSPLPVQAPPIPEAPAAPAPFTGIQVAGWWGCGMVLLLLALVFLAGYGLGRLR